MGDFFTAKVIPLLWYSGPLVVLGLPLWISGIRKGRSLFWSLMITHLVAFIPFVVGSLVGLPDAVAAIILPALTGAITFLVGIVFLIHFSLRRRPGSESH